MNPWIAIPTFAATLAWISVVTWYWIRAKWWKAPVGRNTMGISMFIALVLARLSYMHLDDVPPAPVSTASTLFGVFVYLGLTVAGLHRLYLIEDSQRKMEMLAKSGTPNRRHDDPK